MPPADTDTGRLRFVCSVLFLATLLLFSRATECDFLDFDDPDFLTQNSQVHTGLHWQSVREAFSSSDAGNWAPLTRLSHVAAWQMWGNHPRGHHAINVAVHALNAVLAFLLLRQLSRMFWTSAASAALFAWHPLRVESVAWIAERKDVLSVCFGLLTLWAYAVYAAQTINQGQSRRRWYGLALAGFAAGLLCKPMLVTVPFVLLLLDVWPLQRTNFTSPEAPRFARWKKLLLEKTPFFLLSCGSCLITYLIQQKDGGLADGFPFDVRLANAAVSIVRYLGAFFWPANLAVAYAHPGHWPAAVTLGSISVLLIITGFAVWRFKEQPCVLVGWLWFLGMLAPVLGIMQSGLQAMADRYTYLPIVGIQLALFGPVSSCISKHKYPRVIGGTLTAVLGLTCAALTWHQIGFWMNSRALFSHALALSEKNHLAQTYLATSCTNAGELEIAIKHYQRALELAPNYAAAHYGLGFALEKKGLTKDAEQHYQQAVQLKPNFPQAQYGFGLTLLAQGRASEALPHFQAAALSDQYVVLAHRGLGLAKAALGNAPEAIQHFDRALALEPNSWQAQRDYGHALATLNRPAEARTHLETALKLNPSNASLEYDLGLSSEALGDEDKAAACYTAAIQHNPSLAEAHYNLGVILLNRNQLTEANERFHAAARSQPDFGLAYFGLGVVAALAGHFDQAITCYNQALAHLPNHAEIHNALGYALAQTGHAEQALAHWETAFKLDPTIAGLSDTLKEARRQAASPNQSPE